MENLLDSYSEVRECDYKDEHYSVRDNGAVMRHPKPGKKARPNDNEWTFGTRDEKTAYMKFGTHRIHIIVANAFLGEHDSKIYVVDHIDTNRCNNRVSNLRWFTRLENALNNPITRKRIEWLCGGDIQKFIDDPSCLRTEGTKAQDLSWMRTVTPEEAKTAMANLMRWAKKAPALAPAPDGERAEGKKDPEWMFKPQSWGQRTSSPEVRRHISYCLGVEQNCESPQWAVQFNWDPPTRFPLCPSEYSAEAIDQYFSALSKGLVFSENKYGKSKILDFAKDEHRGGFVVLIETPDNRPYAVIRVSDEEGRISHVNAAGIYYNEADARKRMSDEIAWPSEEEKVLADVTSKRLEKVESKVQGNDTEFLLVPDSGNATAEEYFGRLTPGAVFARNRYGESKVIQALMSKDKSSIGVAVSFPSELKNYAAYKVYCINGQFYHQFLHTCFEENGALQRMTEAAGETWTGPDSIDNYC